MSFSTVIAKIISFPARVVTSALEFISLGEFTNLTGWSYQGVDALEKMQTKFFTPDQKLSADQRFGYDFLKGTTPIINVPGLFSGK